MTFWTNELMAQTEPKRPRVLMACPTWSGCEYALKEWAAAYHAQTYPAKGCLQVDNSDGPTTNGNSVGAFIAVQGFISH